MAKTAQDGLHRAPHRPRSSIETAVPSRSSSACAAIAGPSSLAQPCRARRPRACTEHRGDRQRLRHRVVDADRDTARPRRVRSLLGAAGRAVSGVGQLSRRSPVRRSPDRRVGGWPGAAVRFLARGPGRPRSHRYAATRTRGPGVGRRVATTLPGTARSRALCRGALDDRQYRVDLVPLVLHQHAAGNARDQRGAGRAIARAHGGVSTAHGRGDRQPAAWHGRRLGAVAAGAARGAAPTRPSACRASRPERVLPAVHAARQCDSGAGTGDA